MHESIEIQVPPPKKKLFKLQNIWRVLFTWPNQDDRMNMTKKLTMTNINIVIMTENIINTTNDEHYDRKFGQIHQYFGHIHPLMFVVVKLRSSSNV